MRRRSVSGKRALVTGGSSGIGRHVALELAQRGAKVVIVSHEEDRLASVEKELHAISPDAFACLCNVGSQEDVDRMAATVRGRIGGVDVLINNAGFGTYRTFSDSDPSELADIVNVNLLGVIRCTRALVPDMIQQRSGVILNVASIAGRLPLTPSGTYAAAKHGVYALSQILDDELARFDITVCVVCPGRVQTSFFDHPTFRDRAHRRETEYTVPLSRVSTAMIRAIETGKRVTFVPWTIGVLAWGFDAFPLLAKPIFSRLNRARIKTYYEARRRQGDG
jgi:uncharacterized protein